MHHPSGNRITASEVFSPQAIHVRLGQPESGGASNDQLLSQRKSEQFTFGPKRGQESAFPHG